MAVAIPLCCPLCKGQLATGTNHYACDPCDTRYPIVEGIPDFRIYPDPYISIEDDIAKGRRVAEAMRGRSFEEWIRYYSNLTSDVPSHMADRFIAYAIAAEERGRWLLESSHDVREVVTGGALLDVGCGSGILSIAAAKLGAASVLGLDVDPDAVTAASRNAADNGVDRLVTAVEGTLESRPGDGPFDLVLANISAKVIIASADHIAGAAKPGGAIVCSGGNGNLSR